MRPLLDRPNVRDGSIHVRMIDIVMQNMQSFYAEHHEDNILLRFQMFLNCIKIPGNDVPESCGYHGHGKYVHEGGY